MNRQPLTPVRLVRGQSINLTTGKITESDDGDFAGAKIGNSEIDLPGHRCGLRLNDLESLYSAILINADHGLIFCGRYADVDDHIAHCK